MSTTSNCGNCRFFFPDNPDPEMSYGVCRRHAPQVVSSSYYDPNKGRDIPFSSQNSPTVRTDYWCGDHEPKEDQQCSSQVKSDTQ